MASPAFRNKQVKMTGDQSRHIKVGDRVCWGDDKEDGGTVTERNWAGVTIKWNKRSEQPVLHNDLGEAGNPTN
jgi:hypothetical protein